MQAVLVLSASALVEKDSLAAVEIRLLKFGGYEPVRSKRATAALTLRSDASKYQTLTTQHRLKTLTWRTATTPIGEEERRS